MFVFKITALVYIIVAGQVPDAPIKILHEMAFPSMNACQEFMKGEVFQMQKEALANSFRIALAKQALAAGDEPPATGLAIQTSCDEDKSI